MSLKHGICINPKVKLNFELGTLNYRAHLLEIIASTLWIKDFHNKFLNFLG